MRRKLDDRTADRLLAGGVAPVDAPPGYEEVAALVASARRPVTGSELASESAVVSLVAAAVQEGATPLPTTPRKTVLTKVLTAKAAAIAAVTFIGAGAAAAATNNLPDPAQTAVSNAGGLVGLDIPKPEKPEKSNGKGPDANGPAKAGLCEAVASGSENGRAHKANSVAFRNLAKAAADAGQSTEAFCADVTTTTVTSTENDEPTNETNESDNRGNAEERGGPPSTAGKSADHAPVTTPNQGEGKPGAPGDNDDQGRATADDRSGGRSNRAEGE